jgi:hypothetical protein
MSLSLNSSIKCANCEAPGAPDDCINDLKSGHGTVCYLTDRCRCSIPAPICRKCHYSRLMPNSIFICAWCKKTTMHVQHHIRRREQIPGFIEVVLLLNEHVLKPAMHCSKFFQCFRASMPELSENWRCITRFFTQLEDGFIPNTFFAFMKMNMRKLDLGISRGISPHIFRVHTNSTEMVRILRMFLDLSCMLTFSIRLFYNKQNDKKTNKKTMMLICRRFLSKFLGNELPFLSLLFRKPCNLL